MCIVGRYRALQAPLGAGWECQGTAQTNPTTLAMPQAVEALEKAIADVTEFTTLPVAASFLGVFFLRRS